MHSFCVDTYPQASGGIPDLNKEVRGLVSVYLNELNVKKDLIQRNVILPSMFPKGEGERK